MSFGILFKSHEYFSLITNKEWYVYGKENNIQSETNPVMKSIVVLIRTSITSLSEWWSLNKSLAFLQVNRPLISVQLTTWCWYHRLPWIATHWNMMSTAIVYVHDFRRSCAPSVTDTSHASILYEINQCLFSIRNVPLA